MKGADDMAVVRVGGGEAVAAADGGGGCISPACDNDPDISTECRRECK